MKSKTENIEEIKKSVVVVIGNKLFQNADVFKDYADTKMHEFLEDIVDYGIYTEPAVGDFPLSEYEEGIEFYYTRKGSVLVNRWILKMQSIFDKYFPNDFGFEPRCCYWKDL